MKNSINDLRNHMFAAIERLSDDDLSEEALKKEIEKSQAISELGKVIIESAKTEILYAKLTGKPNKESVKFLKPAEEEPETNAPLSIERPKAEYSNKSAMGIASGHNA